MSVKLRDSLEWLLLVAMIFGGGAIAQAQNDAAAADEQPTGKIVRIGPAGDSQISIDGATIEGEPADVGGEPTLPKQWIGIFLSPVSDELRAQLDIPADQGVLVRQVVPGSPAAKAGLKPFDILLTANEVKLSDVGQLTDLVRAQGDKSEKITLDLLRRGEHQSIELTPEARPDGAGFGGRSQSPMGRGQAWHLNPRDPLSFNFRGLPGARPTMGGFNFNQMPSGVSVSIQKQNDEPARITVKRGNDTWEIIGDDPSSLAQLPEDLRPFVEQMLAGTRLGQMPSLPPMPMMPGMGPPAGFRNDELQQRLDQMQQQLEELRQRMRDDMEALRAEDAGPNAH